MAGWQEKHFNLPPDTKHVRPPPEPERSGAGFWFFLFLLIATPIGAVAIAYHLGYIGTPAPVEHAVPAAPAKAPAPVKEQPKVNITYTAKLKEPQPDVRTITQARANELNRMIASRTAGIELMTRERSKAIGKEQAAQNDLVAAKERLAYLDSNRPSLNDSGRTYQWNLANSDAVAAAKNATTKIGAQQKVINSLNDRIEMAQGESDAARDELNGATIIP